MAVYYPSTTLTELCPPPPPPPPTPPPPTRPYPPRYEGMILFGTRKCKPPSSIFFFPHRGVNFLVSAARLALFSSPVWRFHKMLDFRESYLDKCECRLLGVVTVFQAGDRLLPFFTHRGVIFGSACSLRHIPTTHRVTYLVLSVTEFSSGSVGLLACFCAFPYGPIFRLSFSYSSQSHTRYLHSSPVGGFCFWTQCLYTLCFFCFLLPENINFRAFLGPLLADHRFT